MTENCEPVEVKSVRGNPPLSEVLRSTKELFSEESILIAAHLVDEVRQYIIQKSYNLILFTGRSGLIADKLLGELESARSVWLESQDKRYNDPAGISLMLDELGVIPSECRLVVLDEHINSGRFKARKTLLALSKSELLDFGFASFVGPYDYHDKATLTIEIQNILVLNQNIDLADKLFFPSTKNMDVWKMMVGLEGLADYYEQSEAVREFIDHVTEKIRSASMTILN